MDLQYVTKEALRHYDPFDYLHGLPYILKKLEKCRFILSKLQNQYPRKALEAAYCMVAFHLADQKNRSFYKGVDRELAAKRYKSFIKKLVIDDEKHYPKSELEMDMFTDVTIDRYTHYRKWFDPCVDIIILPVYQANDDVHFDVFSGDEALIAHNFHAMYRAVISTLKNPTPVKTRAELWDDFIKHESYNKRDNDQESIFNIYSYIQSSRIYVEGLVPLYRELHTMSEIDKHNSIIEHITIDDISKAFYNYKYNHLR